MLSRRELLSTGTTATIGAIGAAALPGTALAYGGVNSDLSRETFLAKLGGYLLVWRGRWVQIRLQALEDGPDDPNTEQFTLVFRDFTGQPYAEGTYFMWDSTHLYRLYLTPAESPWSSVAEAHALVSTLR